MAPEPIAIIGTGCKFPSSSTSPSRLWDLLRNPKDVATKPPADRFNMDGFYDPNPSNLLTTNAKESYFLSESVREFDASFFNIAANEAGSLDPQQRLLLETVYESLEAAGLRMEALRGSSTGVFCGVMVADWEAIMGLDKVVPEYAISGLARNNLANRISYFFDWNGPSMAIDTACSSSMVALHQGISALINRECSVVAAVGTNLILSPNLYFAASNVHMLSPDSRCRMWDDRANGYARGEGVASVIMKRLSDAIADGDPIECVIRASGVNQDGRTLGLTMPSGEAQEKLIRSTYALAGLDPSRPEDRPQYFEAHGTGTQAGDFQESSGIYNAFFGAMTDVLPDEEILHVGSIKTVLGHAEGCAGLAGIIKASLCIQHGIIPPNLHFENLNPKLEGYSSRLKIPTEATQWPQLKEGTPRRVSVNSFGFGGTNSHAILESYEPTLQKTQKRLANGTSASQSTLLPFAFSAASERSLGAVLERYSQYLQGSAHIDVLDFASSLIQNRSALMYRVTLYAADVDELQTAIQKELALRKSKDPSTVISRPETEKKRILGIFTGQGAQWPQMGLDLISTFPAARSWFEELQQSLDELPSEYRPDFTLLGELSASKSASRLHVAAVAQPLCTAVQIVLVNILSTLGTTFDAVVGHSSGEIGAVYAAGVLTARDAIRIAYLRGNLVHLAGSHGQRGSMLAAGLSVEEANVFCAQPEFAGRICVAAYNSPSSVTLSGDADAIQEAEQQLKSHDKFARPLIVDTAYHSHHMLPCAEPYLRALAACKITVREPTTTTLYSTVYEGLQLDNVKSVAALTGKYWADNMCNPVLFYPGLKAAITASSPGLIIEVGPHPALKGPVLQGISETFPGGSAIPYIATLSRGQTGVGALAGTIGSLWTHLGVDAVNIPQYVALYQPSRKLGFIHDLPSYPFDHSQSYWTESRRSKAYLYRGPRHELLGDLSEEVAEGEWRWRNFLFPNNLEYLAGHQIQSQTIFPATGYVALALEATRVMAEGRSLSLFQINDLTIDQAIAFPEDSERGIETLFRMYQIRSEGNTTYATFNCHAGLGGSLKSCASGQLVVTWGEMDVDSLPPKYPSQSGFSKVVTDDFYAALSKLGYGYAGLFRGITTLERKLNASRGLLKNVSSDSLLLHPATMDCGLQCLLGAIGSPGDGELSRLQIPTRIETTTINPMLCGNIGTSKDDLLTFEANVTGLGENGASGDVSLFTTDGHGLIVFEGIHVTPLMQPTASDDRPIFSEISWSYLEPNAEPSHIPTAPSQFWLGKVDDPQHICFAVIQELLAKLTDQDRENLKGHRNNMVAWCDRVVELTCKGQHPLCKQEWINENPTKVLAHLYKTAQPIIVEITEAIRHNFLAFLRDEVAMIEVYRKDDLLTRFYAQEQEMKYMSMRVGDLAGQLAFRYPRMKILEIGGGTGSATRSVLGRIGQDFHSYTFTDISAGFFEDAEANFNDFPDRMLYRVLDIEQDPVAQGFEAHSYDLIIASNVLHATKYLQPTMANARRLLKPGGHLIALEITSEYNLQDALLFGVFEGWWLGKIDNRLWGPKISVAKWHELLLETGFGGVDTIVPAPGNPEYAYWCYSVFVTQAVNDRVEQIREPLASTTPLIQSSKPSPNPGSLLIIGGATSKSEHLLPALQEILASAFESITHALTIDSVGCQDSSLAAILCLEDIDDPFFQDLTDKKLLSLKRLLEVGKRWLWVTAGSESENPYLSMSKGFLSCIGYEYRGSLHQYLNIVDPTAVNPQLLATTLMRNINFVASNDYSLEKYVGSVELALRYEDDVMKIPRIVEATPLNLRYAATRRAVTKQVGLNQSNIHIRSIGGKSVFMEASEDFLENSLDDLPSVQIRVRLSLALALKIEGAGFLSLILGTQEHSDVRLVALSTNNASSVSVPRSWTWELPADIDENQEASYLKIVASTVFALNLVQQTNTNTGLLVHGADDVLKHSISALVAAKNTQVHFSTSNAAVEKSNFDNLFLHQASPLRTLHQILPTNLSIIANFDNATNGVFSKIERLLPQDIRRENISSLSRSLPSLSKGLNVAVANQAIQTTSKVAAKVLLEMAKDSEKTIGEISIVPVGEFLSRGQRPNEMEILNWAQAQELPIRVHPASSKVRLSANKTYLLVGMTGDLGQSVAQWMVTRGARNVLLTSRTPKAEPQWIEEMMKLGAEVRIESMDVTDRESILNVDRTIRQTMPPIGGVVNGAMVLQDQFFADSSLETVLGTYKPKIDGSRFLEDIYGGEDLDFFILFGSATAVLGNMGQSSYGAATNYMRSMIRRRQEQGLVGSIIHPAEVRGVGYISRMGSDLLQLMTRLLGKHVVSEKDLHELFAEAILAGNPQSGRNCEIIAGFTQHDPEESPDIIWYTNPEAWPLANYHLHATSSKSTGTLTPVREQLESATSTSEAAELVLAAFTAKIIQKLHLSENVSVTPETNLVELGADSLVAVDLRTWFMKQLEVEIPILEILGGASLGDLSNTAASALADHLVPNMVKD